MSASLTISSASVAADGRTVTVNIGGSTGTITPSSGVTGFRVISGSNSHNQSSATISGTVLTITLSSFVGSGQTVTIDTIAGNLADAAANTMVLATGQACTNSSTKNASFFALTNAAVYYTGLKNETTNFGRAYWDPGNYMRRVDLVFTGTDLSMVCYQYYGGSLLVKVDGGAETTVPIVATGVVEAASWYEVPIAAGLSEGNHRVSLIMAWNSNALKIMDKDNGIRVAGAAPALLAPTAANTAIDVQGTSYVIKATEGTVDRTAYIQPDDNWTWAGAAVYQGVGAGNPPGAVVFRATCDTIKVFASRNAKWVVEVDGVPHGATVTPSPADGTFDWITLATGLDATAEHRYSLGRVGADNSIYAIQTAGGSGISASALPALRTQAFYGDSISIGFSTTDSTYAHSWMMAIRALLGSAQRGVAGSTVIGASAPAGASAARIAEVTGLAHLDKVVVLYGTNDVQAYYNSGGTPDATYSAANFYTAYLSMIDGLSQGGTNNAKIDCWGILIPGWSAPIDALTPSYNTQIQNAVAALKAAYPAKAANFRYVDSANFMPAGAGVHPNDAQSVNIADRGLPFILDAPYTLSGPSSGTVGAASSNFTVALASGGKFNGTETVTISDGSAGGLLTPSVGSPGTSTVVVTPADGATSFTFTYTAASAGSKTIAATNAQVWPNPSSTAFAPAVVASSMFFAAV